MTDVSIDMRDSAPTLRWIYIRGREHVRCELSLDASAVVYEFRIRALDRTASESIERFADVGAAFRRQSEFEAALVREGWSLHHYEKSAAAATQV